MLMNYARLAYVHSKSEPRLTRMVKCIGFAIMMIYEALDFKTKT